MRFGVAITAVLAACAPPSVVPPPGSVHQIKPSPFPYPGVYSGALTGGTVTYLIKADGTGLSCIRKINGGMMFGDVLYDGTRLYTEDGTLEVVSLSAQQLRLRTAYVNAELQVLTEPPTVCRGFFGKR